MCLISVSHEGMWGLVLEFNLFLKSDLDTGMMSTPQSDRSTAGKTTAVGGWVGTRRECLLPVIEPSFPEN